MPLRIYFGMDVVGFSEAKSNQVGTQIGSETHVLIKKLEGESDTAISPSPGGGLGRPSPYKYARVTKR